MSLIWRKFFAFACLFLIFLSFTFAKKKKAKEVVPEPAATEASESLATKITVPERRKLSYFSDIDGEIIANVEKGSPESLRTAINHLKRSRENMTESEQVLHYIAVSIMQLCWKSQNFSEATTGQSIRNDYTGAISSSKNGFYDPPAEPSDLLSYALPSLVLVASETKSDYYPQSEAFLKKAVGMNPNSVFVNYLLGVLYQRMENYKLANEYFGIASDLAGECFECSYSFAESFMPLSDSGSAFTLSEKLLKTYPQHKKLLQLCAEAAFASGDYLNAELYVGRVLQIEPENAYFLLFRARILVKKGEYIRAASLLDAYSKRDSSSRDYLLLRFIVQKNWNKNIAAATATIENALQLYPDDEEIILEAATLSSEVGAKIGGKSGEELAEKILEKDSENFDALQIKIDSMVFERKWTQAYNASRELIAKENVPDSALFTHIKICLSARKTDEAWQYASKLYAQNPADEDVLRSYIDVLVSMGRKSEASQMIASLLPGAAAKMKSFLYYERSFVSEGESNILADLRSSLTANPRNKDSLFRLYKIYYNKKEYRKAQYYLKQVVALSPKDEVLLKLNQELEALLK